MKKILFLVFSLFILTIGTNPIHAQSRLKATVTIASLKQTGDQVRFTIKSSRPLIFGNNEYVLYIGKKEFSLSEVPADDANKTITFLLNEADFKALEEGAPMYVTYGHVNTEMDMVAYAQQSHKCWAIGTFNKALLTK